MTQYTAILFMYNDENRAKFVVENFTKHNSHIPLIIYNGGRSARDIFQKFDVKYEEGHNLWHKFTRCPPGSFSYDWFVKLFDIGLNMKSEHLIFLETDVLCTRKIEGMPLYDIAGPVTRCGPHDEYSSYDYWGGYLKDTEYDQTDWKHKFHTGMGATAFSKNFFIKCLENLKYVEQAYKLIPFHMCQDLHITLLARYSDCTMGDWSEVSDTRGTYRRLNQEDESKWYFDSDYSNKALVHNYKI